MSEEKKERVKISRKYRYDKELKKIVEITDEEPGYHRQDINNLIFRNWRAEEVCDDWWGD